MLGELPAPFRARILADALPVELPAGGTIYRDENAARVVLVVSGLVRVFLSAPDGRTLTIRYARAGELLGIPTIVGGPVPVSVELVTEARLLMLNAGLLRHLGQTEPAVGWMLAREVTRHLLDLASGQHDGRLIAPVTQQGLAEAVGSARPAVAKVIAELRKLGLV